MGAFRYNIHINVPIVGLRREMKIIKRSGIKHVAAKLRVENKKIVFTNGCLDILHIGHVRYLKEASGLGDVLIVGLNSDSSMSRIKPGRPLTPEGERAEILSSLSVIGIRFGSYSDTSIISIPTSFSNASSPGLTMPLFRRSPRDLFEYHP